MKPKSTIDQRPATESVLTIPISALKAAPDNPRRQLGDLTELKTSIEQNGILQPLVVTPDGHDGYVVVLGHRRLAAAELAGVVGVPCIVRTYADVDRVIAMGVENLQREDLSPLEEAELYVRLSKEPYNLSQRAIAERTGSSQARVSKRSALLRLPEAAVKAIDSGRITLDDAAEVAALSEEPGFEEALEGLLPTGVRSADLATYVKSKIEDNAAVERRAATRKRLQAEGQRVLGEAQNSWTAGPGYPAGTLDVVVRNAGKKFDPAKHSKLKCAGWFITYQGEAVEACDNYRQHESRQRDQRFGEDPERKAQREERERYVEAMDKLRARRHDYIRKILAGGLTADARDHVVRQAICIYEPNWELAVDWLGIEVDPDDEHRFDMAPHYSVLRWIQEAPSRRQLQAALALVLEEGENVLRYETPKSIGEDMAPLARQHFEFLSFAGYKLAPEEQAWLAGEQEAVGSDQVELDPLPEGAEQLPPGDDSEKEHPGYGEPLVDALPGETESRRLERERRAKIDAAKRQLEEVAPARPGAGGPGQCWICGCHGDCPDGCTWVIVDDVQGWQCSTHATADALLAREG